MRALTPTGGASNESSRSRRRNPEAGRRADAVLLPHHLADRNRRRRRPAPGDLPAGTGRRGHGRRLRPRHQRQAARRVRHAVWPGRRERLSRHRHHLFRLRPGAVPAARPRPRQRAGVSAVQLRPHLCQRDQAGGDAGGARANSRRHAPRLQRPEERPRRPGDGGAAARPAGPGSRRRGIGVPRAAPHPRRAVGVRRGGCRPPAAGRAMPDDPGRPGRAVRGSLRRTGATGRDARRRR